MQSPDALYVSTKIKEKSHLCKILVRLLVLAVRLTQPLKRHAMLPIRPMSMRSSNTRAPCS